MLLEKSFEYHQHRIIFRTKQRFETKSARDHVIFCVPLHVMDTSVTAGVTSEIDKSIVVGERYSAHVGLRSRSERFTIQRLQK